MKMCEPKTEDENVPFADTDRDIALGALLDFNRGQYSNSIDKLLILETSIGPNLKLTHNKVIVQFYQNDFKTTDVLRKALQNLTAQSAADDTKPQDECCLHYNTAIIMFHLRQPQSALKLMEKVMVHIDTLEVSIAQKASLLICELYLATGQPNKALHLVESMEARLESAEEMYAEVLDRVSPTTQHFHERLQHLQVRALLAAHRVTEAVLVDPVTPETVFLRAKSFYLRGETKQAVDVLSGHFLKQEDVDGKPELPTVQINGEDYISMLANNLAVIEFSRGRFHLATKGFQNALANDETALQEERDSTKTISTDDAGEEVVSEAETSSEASLTATGPQLHIIGASNHIAILYNLGVSLLFSGRPRDAFECLLEPLQYQHGNPRLWLRIAECCIMVHEQSIKNTKKSRLFQETMGKNPHLKVVLSQITPLKYLSEDGQSHAIPSPTLEFAALCLKCVMNLIPSDNSPDPIPNISTTELCSLRNSALAASAYVCLSIGDYTLALEYGQTLLTQSDISDCHRMLGNLYCAEALVLLDKISDAIRHLEPDLITGVSTRYPKTDFTEKNIHTTPPSRWCITDIASAQQVMMYNLSVALAIRGDLVRAKQILDDMNHGPQNTYITMLRLYIELQSGNFDRGRELIHLHHGRGFN